MQKTPWLRSGSLDDGSGFNADADIEPFIRAMLDKRLTRRGRPPYKIVSVDELGVRLQAFLGRQIPDATISHLTRMGGGGSKEQFRFRLSGAGDQDGNYVLRMDPFESVVETSRQREAELLNAMQGVVPVPHTRWVDADGAELGRPFIIMTFASGVIKPSAAASGNVTGTGLFFGADWRAKLGPQFIEILRAIHLFDWRSAQLPSFKGPDHDPYQAARWQVEWWARVWRDDRIASSPIVALAEAWMRDHLPACPEPVLLHGDFRSGNFLFDEESGRITAFLDWELAHIGDPHEDLAWSMQTGSRDGSDYYFAGLFRREELLKRYADATSFAINLETLHFYEVFSAYKCLVIIWATGPKVAHLRYSHQDLLLTWMASIGHFYHSELCRLLRRGVAL